MHANKLIVLAAVVAILAGCTSAPANEGSSSPTATEGGGGGTGGVTTSAASGGSNPYPLPSSTTQVAGSGATFPKPLIETWGIKFAKDHPKVQVSYAGGGSGKGKSDIQNKAVLFAGSDSPLSASDRAKASPGLYQFPETLGLVAVVYNVAGVDAGLKLDGPTVGKIYLGQISYWDDPAIKDLNSGVTLPHNRIAIVYRSDSSGTTFTFSDWMCRTSPEWNSTMSVGDVCATQTPAWTKSSATQLSGNGNDGVGSTVKSTPDTIGYVELAYVRSLGLNAGTIKNHDGEWIGPSTDGAAKDAAGAAAFPAPDGDWSRYSISNSAGAGAYPISTFTYILVYNDVATYGGKVSATQMNAFRAWLYWALHDGQSYSDALGYAPLPTKAVEYSTTALSQIKVG